MAIEKKGAVVRFIPILFLALFASLAWATTPPETFVARYTLSIESVQFGETERKLEKLPSGEFLYTTRNYATGVTAMLLKDHITEQSRFRFVKGQFQPVEYRYERNGGKKTKLRSARFDWQAKQVEGNHDGEAWQLPVKPGTMDRLLYQLAASYDLQKQRKRFSYQVADHGELKTYDLTMAGVETVDTPLGSLKTMKLQRIDGEYETTLWMAKDLAYLPVRIEHTEDGKRYRAELKEMSGLVLTKPAKPRK